MQHALNPNFAGSHANPYNGGGHHRPSASTSDLPSPGFAFSPATSPQPSPAKPSRPPKPSAASTPSTPAKTPSPSVGTSSKPTPTKPKRRRASSDITQSKTTGDQNRCAGIKKDGERCTRTVKNGPALASQLDDDESGEIERFCHQHSKEIFNGQSGFYARKNGQWLEFEDWIPGYLQPDTQLALRVEMEKARSLSEKPGYIYTFEIRDPNSPKTIKLKVGRAVNLNKRIDQWAKQCKSKEQVLRGWYPSKEDPDSLMKGRVDPGPPGGACHRLERLIHLELADLISSEIYLDPKWPSVTPDGGSGGTSTKKATNPNDKKCPDCGQMHKEIFEFTRVQAGHHAGREWESIVRPIVEKWGGFVDSYL
ncbi:hypothetical protein DL96DRAFT_1666885 [Flagelloscypha sp. PMI_526]|nr:hypothetical protein DL96DRAFT_1666885 [Flagelloscypha sp. PMI_526]